MNLQYDPVSRARRRQRFVLSFSILGAVLFCLLAWALRELILPIIVGALVAYLCNPILSWMRRKHLPKGMGVVVLLTLFSLAITQISGQIRDAMPDEQGELELRVRIQYKLNERYLSLMQLDQQGKGNLLYTLIGEEIEPVRQRLNEILSLPEEEQEIYEQYYHRHYDEKRFEQPYFRYFQHNVQSYAMSQGRERQRPADDISNALRQGDGLEKEIDSSVQEIDSSGLLATLGSIISIWLVSPFVFLFVLLDDGDIKKGLVTLVPNRYFEMALTVIDNVDKALGRYLRGTFIECSLVGFTLMIGFFLIGIEAKWAFLIGSVAGLANAIPFLGPAIGLIIGLLYALIVEDFSPLFSFISADNILIWVAIVIGVTQLLDNAFFQPVVLGNAVSLHPLVVIIGVMGGSILLGFTGMLFAIPVIVIFKVVTGTLIKEMKAYQII